MSLKETLNSIDEEIASSKKFKAADRLRNLINEYPNDLTIWDKLAQLYYDSGFLDAAGRYWILFEPNDNKKKKSIETYEETVNNSGCQILNEITYRGDKNSLPTYAQKKMLELEADSRERAKYVPKFKPKLNKNQRKKTKYQKTLKDKVIEKLIIGLLILIIVLAIIGLIRVIQWIF